MLDRILNEVDDCITFEFCEAPKTKITWKKNKSRFINSTWTKIYKENKKSRYL